MRKNFKLPWKGLTVRDPRVVMRVILGALLVAFLGAVVIRLILDALEADGRRGRRRRD